MTFFIQTSTCYLPGRQAGADEAMVSLEATDNASEPGWVVTARTVSDMDVAPERTRMYSQRVLVVTTHPGFFR